MKNELLYSIDNQLIKEFSTPDLDTTIPFPNPKIIRFQFIDLFAGIGGFRIAMQNLGGECVFSSEIDPQARKSYQLNFGEMPKAILRRLMKRLFRIMMFYAQVFRVRRSPLQVGGADLMI